ncbi:MAG TPA: FAD-linked oxidase C-terminal domain-containing protein [Candidatus Xenobia bacterium]|jgi:FAD/FMN-containing dehydrogenase/Fe-S oxidoreductase
MLETHNRRHAFKNEDRAQLETMLRERLEGEVRFEDGDRALYATDASNYRQVPIGVVVPRTVEDVVWTVACCRAVGAPVLARGGGTSLAGQCCNVAVVLDFTKYLNRVISVDPDGMEMVVEPGIVLDQANKAVEQFGLRIGPDPATHDHCTIGGMIGNNSCGMHAQYAGKMEDNIIEMDVLLYDGTRMTVGQTPPDVLAGKLAAGGREGEIYRQLRDLRDRYAPLIRSRYPKIPRRVSGYNLPELLPERHFDLARALVGTESTCAIVLRAQVRLVPDPPYKALLVLGYPSICEAGDHVPEIVKFRPLALEGMDDRLIQDMEKKGMFLTDVAKLPPGKGWLVVQFGGDTEEEARGRARTCKDGIQAPGLTSTLVDKASQEKHIWRVREAGLGATAFIPGHADTFEGWEDSAVPVEKLGSYLRDLRKLFDKYGFDSSTYGHFGQACVHCRIPFNFRTNDGVNQYLAFMDEATDLVVRYGGSFSGEHGDGQSKAMFLPKMYGPELVTAMNEFKAIWDPEDKLNPRKIARPYRVDENLRLGPEYRPHDPHTHFAFAADGFSFAHASQRCVGVGKCRRWEGEEDDGTMCPSFMVTHEEKHSTRGRAHLLFEMLHNQGAIHEGWKSEAVKDALDLCLACKGCKGDCPVNVDMANYKAEFLSHYYEGRVRPRAAYSMGLIYWWARLASMAPWLVNLLGIVPGAKALAGVAPQRSLPKFAPRTFKAWFRTHAPATGEPVLLWVDTFVNHFHPETGQDAVFVLEKLGYRVEVPEMSLCCGRPLYDWGMLDTAKGLLTEVVDALQPYIEAGTPIVGLEPSCVAVFRDELPELLHGDGRAHKLSQQVLVLSEFLQKYVPDTKLPRLGRKALLHGHCHQKAVMKMTAAEAALEKLGVEVSVPEPGCCGMAGSFGFEEEHYDISMKIGEQRLLPAVRKAPSDTLVLADGFSCRTQIEQGTGRRPIHLATLLAMALGKQPPQAVRRPPVAPILALAAVAAGYWLAGRVTGKKIQVGKRRSSLGLESPP